MNIRFRSMKMKDIPSVYKIECDLFPDPWSKKSFEMEVKDKNVSFPFIVEAYNEIIGYIICWFYLNEFHIGNIAVMRQYQGRGIGKLMLNKVFESFGDYQRAYLEVRESNKIAINLYKSFGFEMVYRRKSYYSNGDDALVMVKTR